MPTHPTTHKPAEAVHQIDEPQADALRLAAAQQAVQAAVPEAIEQMAVDRYKVVPSHESMFHRWAVVAGNGTQQLYIGREGECQSMALKFTGAFLDGAFVAMKNTTPAHPAERVPQGYRLQPLSEYDAMCEFIAAAPQPAKAAPPNVWQQAVDRALVNAHLGVAGEVTAEEATKILNDLICWNIQVATDPLTNGGKVLVSADAVAANPLEATQHTNNTRNNT